jgi:hypothetical protein
MHSKKRRGELAEMAFVSKVTSLGFVACRPCVETSFDFVLESRGCLYRIQVKSAWREGSSGYCVKLTKGTGPTERPYRRHEADFIVIYIIPEDAWYVVPIAQVLTTWAAYLRPGRNTSRCKLEKFRESWELLGRPPRSRREKRHRLHTRHTDPDPRMAARRRALHAWNALGSWLMAK